MKLFFNYNQNTHQNLQSTNKVIPRREFVALSANVLKNNNSKRKHFKNQ